MAFKARAGAGGLLAQKIFSAHPEFVGNKNVVVLGIPRGGVVVAASVSKALRVPLDVLVVRKLGVPHHPEFAFGAVDLDGNAVINGDTVWQLGLTDSQIESVKEKEFVEAKRREESFRKGKGILEISGKVAIIVDDGVATGATSEAAVRYVMSKDPKKVILATPVIAADTLNELNSKFEILEVIYLEAPKIFAAVGQFYENFPQVTDGEVTDLLGSNTV